MRFAVLGPLEVVDDDGSTITPEAAQQRRLLALLLCHHPAPVPSERLIDALWSEPRASARRNLQVLVHRLRRRLGDERLRYGPAGYRLAVQAGEIDAEEFEVLCARGQDHLRAGEIEAARDTLAAALAVWRDTAYAGLDEFDPIGIEAARLNELRLVALEDRARANIAAGQQAQTVAELTRLVAEHPLRESARELLMLALHRSGRSADALDVYRQGRRTTIDELGLEPGAGLRELERVILAGDPPSESGAEGSAIPETLATPAELPAPDRTFTGREAEIERMLQPLSKTDGEPLAPILAISGPGGVGKSALARQVAHAVIDRFPDGQLYINLHGSTPGADPTDPRDALGRFLRSLGLIDARIPDAVDEASTLFRSITADRRILIVLDNATNSTQIRPLLPGRGGPGVIVTSRAVPADLDVTDHIHLASLSDDEAGRLLGRLAGAERVADEPDAATELAGLCGNLPLALRIAGARLTARPDWSLTSMCERLRDSRARLDELAHGELAVRSSCAVSFAALPESTSSLFAALGLLDLADVTAPVVAALVDRPVAQARHDLDRLVEARLLDADPGGRYVLHDLLRLFARERAAETFEPAERDAALTRVVLHYLATARAALHMLAPTRLDRLEIGVPAAELHVPAAELAGGSAAGTWVRAESANLVAVTQHATTVPGDGPAIVVALSAVLVHLLHAQMLYAEQATVVRAAIEMARRAEAPAWQALAHNDMGMTYAVMERCDDAERHLRLSLEFCESLGDIRGQGRALDNLGNTATHDGRPSEAVALHRRALEVYRAIDTPPDEARALNNLGWALHCAGRHHEALDAFQASLRLARQLGDMSSAAGVLLNLGELHVALNDTTAALTAFGEATEMSARSGNRRRHALALWKSGDVRHQLGNLDDARADWRRALDMIHDGGLLSRAEIDEIMADPVPHRPAVLRE